MKRWRTLSLTLMLTIVVGPVLAVPSGKPAPSFSLRKLGGGRLALRDLRGKEVLLSFWASG